MPLTRKQITIGVFIAACITIIVIIIVMVARHNSISGGSGGGPPSPSCISTFGECDGSIPCCDDMDCKNKLCRYTETAPKMYAFQLNYNGKCIGLNSVTKTLALTDNCDWDNNWWSWDQKNLRLNTMVDNKPLSLCLGGPITAGGQVLIQDASHCSQQTEIRLTIHNNIASITSADFRYCAVLTPVDGMDGHYNLVWKNCVDLHSGEGTLFNIDTRPPGVNCSMPGGVCTGTGKTSNCCPPYRSCLGGFCWSCVGEIPECPSDSMHPVCQSNGIWKCESRCTGDKPKCDDSETPSCTTHDNGKTWKWECVSACQGQQTPSNCPTYSCEKGDDGEYSYQCTATCDEKHVHTPSPPADVMAKLAGCTKDPDGCYGLEDNQVCYKCGDDHKVLYWNCVEHDWEVNEICSKNSPGSGYDCVAINPGACDGKKGTMWANDDAPKDWCELASSRQLKHISACKPGDATCETPVYYSDVDTGGQPIPYWPTVSQYTCSHGNGSANIGNQIQGNPNPNATLYLGKDGKYLLDENSQSFVYNDYHMQYNPDSYYYRPSEISKTTDPPFCRMDTACENDGTFKIKKALQMKDHANFTETDPRASGGDVNKPPTEQDVITVGACDCESPWVGYRCTEKSNEVCGPHGTGVTDVTGDTPPPGIKCICDGEGCHDIIPLIEIDKNLNATESGYYCCAGIPAGVSSPDPQYLCPTDNWAPCSDDKCSKNPCVIAYNNAKPGDPLSMTYIEKGQSIADGVPVTGVMSDSKQLCKSLYTGDKCQYGGGDCSGHGFPDDSGKCQCSNYPDKKISFSGDKCQILDGCGKGSAAPPNSLPSGTYKIMVNNSKLSSPCPPGYGKGSILTSWLNWAGSTSYGNSPTLWDYDADKHTLKVHGESSILCAQGDDGDNNTQPCIGYITVMDHMSPYAVATNFILGSDSIYSMDAKQYVTLTYYTQVCSKDGGAISSNYSDDPVLSSSETHAHVWTVTNA